MTAPSSGPAVGEEPAAAEEPPRFRGGCRPGMVGCRRGCGHRAMVREYRAARAAAELAREAATSGYATEVAEYGPLITFRDWLVQRADPDRANRREKTSET